MATPIVEQITQEIKDRLAEITVANGFNYDLVAARPNRQELSGDYVPKDKTSVLITRGKVEDKNYSSAGNPRRICWNQEYAIDTFGFEDDEETETVETRLQKMAADVEMKLLEDAQRATLAIKTEVTLSTIDVNTKWSDVVVMVNVWYRVREGDPYTSAN